jgi:hypothetical protein
MGKKVVLRKNIVSRPSNQILHFLSISGSISGLTGPQGPLGNLPVGSLLGSQGQIAGVNG